MDRSLALHRAATVVLCLLGLTSSGSEARAAFLEGKTLTVDYTHKTNVGDGQTGVFAVVTVGPGVELPNFGMRENPPLPALVDIDISDTTILFTLVIDQPPAFQDSFQFTDVLGTIPRIEKVAVDPTTDWAGFEPIRIVTGPDVLLVNFGGLSGLAGQKLLLNLTPGDPIVPEPAEALLGAIAFGAIGVRRRC